MGHPFVNVVDACKDMEAYLGKEGLIECTIVPLERLYHPMLPFRANQKLMFSLCRTCFLISNSGDCRHKTNEERPSLAHGSLMKCGWPGISGIEFLRFMNCMNKT